MAELVWCPVCSSWKNLELREATCNQAGDLVCAECGAILEEAG